MAQSKFAIPEFYNGNIDLDNRQVSVNKDEGYIQTEYSTGFDPHENDPEMRDKFNIGIPQIINGELVGYDQAVKNFYKTGEHLGIRERGSDENASAFYKRIDGQDMKIHERQDAYYNQGEGRKLNPLSELYEPKGKDMQQSAFSEIPRLSNEQIAQNLQFMEAQDQGLQDQSALMLPVGAVKGFNGMRSAFASKRAADQAARIANGRQMYGGQMGQMVKTAEGTRFIADKGARAIDKTYDVGMKNVQPTLAKRLEAERMYMNR